MKADRSVWFKSYFAVVTMCGGAVCWSVLFPTTPFQTLWIVGGTAAAWWLPWDKMITLRQILWLVASAIVLPAGITVLESSVPTISLWQWLLGWGLILTALFYFGGKAMYEASILTGLLAMGVLLLSFALALPLSDGVIAFDGGSLSTVAGGIVTLLGSTLTGREMAQDTKAARWGGMTACLIWGLCALLPPLMWSRPALEVMEQPLFACWQRLSVFSVVACPDALLAALVAMLALWQNGAALHQFRRLLKK